VDWVGEPPCFAHFLDDEGRMPDRAEITIRRAYDPAPHRREVRVLVDRLWPRGLSKKELGIDRWAPDVAPSDDLRSWFGHDPGRC
jgi:uncharacterized protein YeaO (DUF488 family)